ncbi:MAG: hypothetical protein M1838_002310 [Thelocarpon superellum]|nr:MAG: hypothetical protein M1838_002310 [Thelocarpon superellum]
MSQLDPTVASVVDAHAQAIAQDQEDADALLSTLEDDDPAFAVFREQRLQQLQTELARAKRQRDEGYGSYVEVKEEKGLMDMTTESKWVVVHFFKPDFGRCGVMDAHLEELAVRHVDTRFLRINVENAPFLVTKLKVQVLPCVLPFVQGISTDRIVGFEGLGAGDDFATKDLEARLLQAGVLNRATTTPGANPSTSKYAHARTEDDDDDDDWD